MTTRTTGAGTLVGALLLVGTLASPAAAGPLPRPGVLLHTEAPPADAPPAEPPPAPEAPTVPLPAEPAVPAPGAAPAAPAPAPAPAPEGGGVSPMFGGGGAPAAPRISPVFLRAFRSTLLDLEVAFMTARAAALAELEAEQQALAEAPPEPEQPPAAPPELAPPAEAEPAPAPIDEEAFADLPLPPAGTANEGQVGAFQLLNVSRREVGVGDVAWDEELGRKAQAWAEHLASQGELSHSELGEGVSPGWKGLAENVGTGGNVLEVHLGYLGSPEHKANLENARWTHGATGAVEADGKVYTVQLFSER